MGKVLEEQGMKLLKKWGMRVPSFVIIDNPDQLLSLSKTHSWLTEGRLVVKAHEAIGGRMKLGLVRVGLDLSGALLACKEILGSHVGGCVISQVIVSEMIAHEGEYYLAVKSTREGAEILLSRCGGIEIEQNWEQVKRIFVNVGESPSREEIRGLVQEAGFPQELVSPVGEYVASLYTCYDREDGQYIEINPLALRKEDGELVALDVVMYLDGDARFRHPDWDFSFASDFGRQYTQAEKDIMEVDSRIKGSVKFIEIPGGDTALLPAGGGASLYYADAVVTLGGRLANYAEYSGDPPDWAVEALTDKVCSLPGIKRIIVGGAIANFTNVKKTFEGIIAGFRKAKKAGKMNGVDIWVRRGGPYEAEGLQAMKALESEGFIVHVYDRYTPMTDIVDYALKGLQREGR